MELTMAMALIILSFLVVKSAGQEVSATTKDFCWRGSTSVSTSVPWRLPIWTTTWQSLSEGCAESGMHVGSIGLERCDHDGDRDVGSTWTGGYMKAQLVALQETDADIGKLCIVMVQPACWTQSQHPGDGRTRPKLQTDAAPLHSMALALAPAQAPEIIPSTYTCMVVCNRVSQCLP
jgi:hypothetical protein